MIWQISGLGWLLFEVHLKVTRVPNPAFEGDAYRRPSILR